MGFSRSAQDDEGIPPEEDPCTTRRLPDQGRHGTKMEIQLKDTTTLMKTAKTFDFSAIEFDTNAGITINLGELEDMHLYQKVTVDVKLDEPVTFPSGVTKQDVTVADRHAVASHSLGGECRQIAATE